MHNDKFCRYIYISYSCTVCVIRKERRLALPLTRTEEVFMTFITHMRHGSSYFEGQLHIFFCTTIHRYPIFSTRYSVMCKVYTGYCGTSEIEHGLCTCMVDNPSLKLGDYLSVQAHKPCSISLLENKDICILPFLDLASYCRVMPICRPH